MFRVFHDKATQYIALSLCEHLAKEGAPVSGEDAVRSIWSGQENNFGDSPSAGPSGYYVVPRLHELASPSKFTQMAQTSTYLTYQ